MSNLDKNEKALYTGILLVLVVIIIFFFRSHFIGRNSSEKNELEYQNSDNPKKLPPISNEDLSKMILQNKPVVILDIRDQENFKAEHIIGSRNVVNEELSQMLNSADKNKKYIIIDYAGENSTVKLPDNLKDSENIFILSGGFAAWKSSQNRTISRGDPTSFSDQSKVSYIKNDDLKKNIEENTSSLFIIDVQDKTSYSNGHIKGAVNIFLDDIEKRRKEIPLGKKVVVYGKDGLGGFQAAARLFDLGIMNVFVLPDGLDAWKEKGFEVVK
jgi:rhodanese-related sulfurtransferase